MVLQQFQWRHNEGPIIFSVMVGGGKSPPHIENDVSRGQQSKLCGMILLKIKSNGNLI